MHRKFFSKKAQIKYRRKSIRSNRQKGGEIITLKLFNHLDEESSVQISSEATVRDLKQKIANEQNINNINDIQLFLDNELEDNTLLKEYGLSNMSELSLVVFDPDEEEEDYDDEDDYDYDDDE